VELPAPFYALDEHFAIDLPGVRAVFTTRRGGVSEGPYASLNLGLLTADEPERVRLNRARLAGRLGLRLAMGRQVHGTDIREVSEPTIGSDGAALLELPASDGQLTSTPALAPIVLVADCLPIALAAPGAVAMLHAGWRGLAGGIVAAGLQRLRRLAGSGADVSAAIGPGAGGCCYEVGPEVHAAFGRPPQRALLDLKAVAREQLEAAGVGTVHDIGLCTMCSDPALFFSHRRDGGITGRQAGIAWLS
jgi:YfiH family protein